MIGSTSASTYWRATASLWQREVVRFLRQRSRILGALGTPIVFWLFIGSGLSQSFRPPGSNEVVDYLAYAYPGTLAAILLFTAIFSTISIIEDRQAGFLQGVLVAPVGRTAIVLGKILGSSTLALMQAALFLTLAPVAHVPLSVLSVVALMAVMAVVSVGLSGLGFWMAWSMESTQGFHAVMNLFLMPMWLLSGALFPATGATGWVRVVMMVNPLAYGLTAMRHCLDVGTGAGQVAHGPGLAMSLVVTTLFAVLMLSVSIRVANRRG
ncbi:MAG: ABC transporter permease [Planctomycetota bacterium]